jgi:hypothetical protein
VERRDLGRNQALSRDLPARTEENHENITTAASLSVKRTEDEVEGKGRKIGTNERKKKKRIDGKVK